MTEQERAALAAIIEALHVPRDRLGRLVSPAATAEAMRGFAAHYKLPHGGEDRVDQACMILQAMLGRVPRSIRKE